MKDPGTDDQGDHAARALRGLADSLERRLKRSGVIKEKPQRPTVDTSHPNGRAARRRAQRGR